MRPSGCSVLLLVTPRAGVWIETLYLIDFSGITGVTPRAGVWIETHFIILGLVSPDVTPRAGVWIETGLGKNSLDVIPSHTPRGCVD